MIIHEWSINKKIRSIISDQENSKQNYMRSHFTSTRMTIVKKRENCNY